MQKMLKQLTKLVEQQRRLQRREGAESDTASGKSVCTSCNLNLECCGWSCGCS